MGTENPENKWSSTWEQLKLFGSDMGRNKKSQNYESWKHPCGVLLNFYSLLVLIAIEVQPVTFLNHLQRRDCSTVSAATLLRQCLRVAFGRRRPHNGEQHCIFQHLLWQLEFPVLGTAVRTLPSKGHIEQILHTPSCPKRRVVDVGGLPHFSFHEL